MARSDLLIKLAEAVEKGDKILAEKTFESIIAEERSKNHHVVAEKLSEKLGLVRKENYPTRSRIKASDNETQSLIKEKSPRKTLDDLVLTDNVVEICKEVTEEHFKSNLLRANGLEPRNRLLFTGPPGNGKTSLAEAMATELMVPFYIVKYDSLIGSYLGETSARLSKIFNFIDGQDCIIFFDEFETIAKERGAKYETGEIKRVVSSLLLSIDELPSNVIVITASNHAELLDRAVWRRFQVKLSLENPTRSQLESWFINYLQRFEEEKGYSEKTLAKYLHGMSFSDVEQFGLEVQRRHVLTDKKESLRDSISYKLKQWGLPKK